MSASPPSRAVSRSTCRRCSVFFSVVLWSAETGPTLAASAESPSPRGADQSALTVRQKLHATILASVPPLPPTPGGKAPTEAVNPPVVMKPVVVTEGKLMQAVAAALDRAEQERRQEKFTALDGGKIGSIGRFEVGGWWSADGGWTFLRMNKTPTYRQTEAVQDKIKELQELAKIGAGSKP